MGEKEKIMLRLEQIKRVRRQLFEVEDFLNKEEADLQIELGALSKNGDNRK